MTYSTYRRNGRGNISKNHKLEKNFFRKFIFQLVVCLVIVGIIISIKNTNIALYRKLRSNLFYNFKLNSASLNNISYVISNPSKLSINIKKFLEETKENSKIKKSYNKSENIDLPVTRSDGGGNIDYNFYRDISSSLENRGGMDFREKAIVSFQPPLIGSISSPFGNRLHPLKKIVDFHKGIDIEAKQGDIIRAAEKGIVEEARFDSSYGNYIKVRHNNIYTTIYAHCSSLNVRKGDNIRKGDIIGKVGSTGWSSGPHLHFEILKNEKQIDPSIVLK